MRQLLDWEHKTIHTNQDAEGMRQLFHNTKHTAGAFDTETTGLNHMKDMPFLYQFGWYDEHTRKGWTFAVDLEQTPHLGRQVVRVWQALAKTLPIYLGHNIKYDLHMMANYSEPYICDNISDTMIWIRLGTDAIPVRKGGAPLGLKAFATRYITDKASQHEQLLKQERTSISSHYNNLLKKRLGWTKKKIDEFFKDKLKDAGDLPEDKQQAYQDWLMCDLPLYLRHKVSGAVTSDMIQYDKLNRENVVHYGHLDIVWTLEAYDILHKVVRNRSNLDAIRIEESNLYPLYRMERVGFKADKEYLNSCRDKMKEYILERRKDFAILAGQEVGIGQHATIKTILQQQYGLEVLSTNADEIDALISKLKHEGNHEQTVDFLETLQELRTLEKWYSTYVMRFINDLKFSDRLYTTINQTGTVSGRVTSDFQQFPRHAIYTIAGEELFQPRKIVRVSEDEGFKGIVYLDYSQIELRLQAMYTILVGEPDLNLCRAYMPYKCFSKELGPFDFHTKEHINKAYNYKWYYNEEPEHEWVPTDVHGATTKLAFDVDESHPDYKDLRSKGKTVNFAKNYGAQLNTIRALFPDFDEEQIQKIDDAYYKAFPGVRKYHSYCNAIANSQAYAQNLFGVKYFGVSGHNLINMLIQGTGAYFLKWKVKQVDDYLQETNAKSRLQMQIHDELSFEWHEDDSPEIFFKIQKIMSEWEDTIVPIIADMELTTTNWADKYEVKEVSDFET